MAERERKLETRQGQVVVVEAGLREVASGEWRV